MSTIRKLSEEMRFAAYVEGVADGSTRDFASVVEAWADKVRALEAKVEAASREQRAEQLGEGVVSYVQTEDGQWFLQAPADNAVGFRIYSEDQAWDFPPFNGWVAFALEEVPKKVRERLGAVYEELAQTLRMQSPCQQKSVPSKKEI